MGMTAHYIENRGTMSRVSAALACRRFVGSHTYEAIAEMIFDIHTSYGLDSEKITATVTDNASNFGKAFREFLFETPEADEHQDDLDVEIVNTGEVLSGNDGEDAGDISLPHHETCCSHSLNLLATVDADKVKDPTYKRLYRAALAKCSAVWNATHRSSKASDAVKAITERAIITPGATRWNSQYDSIKRLLQIGSKLNDVCQAINTPKFKQLELECLNEYVSVMQPVAIALDKLQGEKEAYFGQILPTLHMLVTKLRAMQLMPLKHCEPLVAALLDGMEKRFEKELTFRGSSSNKIVAAISHPFFKMRWLPDDQKNRCRELFIQTVRDCEQKCESFTASGNENCDKDEFFDYEVTSSNDTEINAVEKECVNYLSDTDTQLTMLQHYRRIQKVFIKFNTTIPSSAPVERLFSTAGQIEVPRRSCLSDFMFEKLLLLKANHK
jgi:hypothetical protein